MSTTLVRIGSITGLTESGNGTTGWNYIGNLSGSFGTPQYGLGDQSLTGDGYYYAVVGASPAGTDGFMLGLDTTNSAQTFSTLEFGVYFDGTNFYQLVEAGSPGSPTSTIAVALGDWIRLSRVGSTITIDRSQNSGSSWTNIHTFGTTSSATLYTMFQSTSNAAGLANKLTLVTQTTATIGNNTGNTYSGVDDVYLDETSPTSSQYGSSYIYAGAYSSGNRKHAVVQFAGISNITGPVTVTSATLSLMPVDAAATANYSIYGLKTANTLSQETWNNRVTGTAWASNGGLNSTDANTTALATTAIASADNFTFKDFTSAGLAALVQDWINGAAPNYGLLVARNPDTAYDSLAEIRFRATSNTDSFRPYLTVTYSVASTATSDGWPIGGNVAVGMLLATGGGGTTITTTTGNSSALGTTALVNVTIQTTTGNSSALGTTANVSRTIQTTTGNASALGTTALISPTIQTTTGNASALGTTALISRTIQTTTGDAAALGITASISSATNTTITCTVGNASALGVTALVSPTIQTTIGNASALGTTALLNTSVQTTTGNAAATGTTALVSPTIQTTTGNASALGTTALLNTTIQTTTGNASALGITASVGSGSNTTITTTTGDVSALGTTALVNVTIQTSTGNAAAAGATSLVNATTQTTAGNATATGTTSLVNVTIQTTTGNAAALGVTAAIVQPGAVVIPTITGDAAAQGVTANITFTEAPSGRRPRSLRLIHDVRVYPSKVQARVQARGVIVRATNPPPAAAPEFVFAPVVAPSPPPPPVSVHAAVMMPRAKATCSARGVSTRIGACATVSGVRGTGRQGVISAAASTRAALQSFRVTTHVNDPDEVWGEQNDDADALFDTILTIID